MSRLVFFLFILYVTAQALPFSLIKKETDPEKAPTLLVIGGIHGNEPGSYFATALLAQYYEITKGNLWIIPNLNHESIQKNNRGIHGDMNRKFAYIAPDDPDLEIVRNVQSIIQDKQIGLILNLHDGHGFYRKQYLNTIFNPNAWGQTCVIDQGMLDTDHPFGNLNDIASRVSNQLNSDLIENHHSFDVRNTNTRFDDEEMKHSLTYFAVTNNKPAFAIETSKNLPTLHHKVFYQLRAIECYMTLMGIEFKRSFAFSPESVRKLLDNNGDLTINGNIFISLDNLKNRLSFIPLQSDKNDFKFSHPLGSVQKNTRSYDLFIGNKKIASVTPSYHSKDKCTDFIKIRTDGEMKKVSFASDFFVNTDFEVINNDPKTRVNVIGFSKKGKNDESNLRIRLGDLDSKYSIDISEKKYRIEFYKENRFCGMVLAHFK